MAGKVSYFQIGFNRRENMNLRIGDIKLLERSYFQIGFNRRENMNWRIRDIKWLERFHIFKLGLTAEKI
jgi:hypothetical protein